MRKKITKAYLGVIFELNVIIYANHMLRAAYPAMNNVAKKILEYERSLEVNDDCMPIKEILNLIPYEKKR